MSANNLLIIDVQHGFINEHTSHIPPIVERLQHVYDHVYITLFHNPPGSNFQRWIGWEHMQPGSSDTEPAFQPAPSATIIRKHSYHTLTPRLYTALHEAGEVAICGVNTDVCVMVAATEMFDAGIRPTILADATASSAGEQNHATALRLLSRQIGSSQIRLTNGRQWHHTEPLGATITAETKGEHIQ